MACNAGVGTNSYAQQLANFCSCPVQGPDNFVWYWPNGNTVVAPTNTVGVTWQNYTPAAGASGPNLNNIGSYRLFSPAVPAP
jgi:hypothetical protein